MAKVRVCLIFCYINKSIYVFYAGTRGGAWKAMFSVRSSQQEFHYQGGTACSALKATDPFIAQNCFYL